MLCTDDQTFNVRQVQSSNSVYLLQPPQDSTPGSELSTPEPTIRAIAQCTTTLELIPASDTGIPLLRRTLPLYKSPLADPRNENGFIGDPTEKEMISKQAASEDIPLSNREFDKAWREVCAFELESQAWLPSPSLLNGLWKSFVSAAAVENVNLANKFQVHALEDMVEEDGFPSVLLHAVLQKVGREHENLMSGCAWACV